MRQKETMGMFVCPDNTKLRQPGIDKRRRRKREK